MGLQGFGQCQAANPKDKVSAQQAVDIVCFRPMPWQARSWAEISRMCFQDCEDKRNMLLAVDFTTQWVWDLDVPEAHSQERTAPLAVAPPCAQRSHRAGAFLNEASCSCHIHTPGHPQASNSSKPLSQIFEALSIPKKPYTPEATIKLQRDADRSKLLPIWGLGFRE